MRLIDENGMYIMERGDWRVGELTGRRQGYDWPGVLHPCVHGAPHVNLKPGTLSTTLWWIRGVLYGGKVALQCYWAQAVRFQ